MQLRRRIPTLVPALALAILAASTSSSATYVHVDHYGKIGRTTSRPFTLQLVDLREKAARFDEDPLLIRMSANEVLDLSRDGTLRDDPTTAACRQTERAAVKGAARKTGYVGYCWGGGPDRVEDSWRPQGITSTSDAYASQTADGTPDGSHGFAVSWYSLREQGSRVSLLNASAKGTGLGKYAHVLLVDPQRGNDDHLTFAATSHVGGLVWYRNWLFAADSSRGLLVFDMNKIYRLPPTGVTDSIGWDPFGRKYAAYGYDYVLPIQFRYKPPKIGTCGRQRDYRAPLCFSFIGLDRSTTPDSIVAGEHRTAAALEASGGRARLTRWSLNPTDGLLCDRRSSCRTRRAPASAVRVRTVYVTPTPTLQGAISWRGRFILSQSNRGGGVPPTLYASTPGPTSMKFGRVRHTRPWVVGPEDLTLWRDSTRSSSTGRNARVWSLTEFAHERVVFGVRLSSVD